MGDDVVDQGSRCSRSTPPGSMGGT
jgi:hypothetical protein